MAQKIDKLTQAYEKYAPKNITLQQYAELVAQDPGLLHAPFSTVNPVLAVAAKRRHNKQISDTDFRNMLRQEINDDVMEQIAKKYAKIYEHIICSDINILRAAWNFKALNEKERTALARKIIEQINKYFGINIQLDVKYNDKYETEIYPDVDRSKISLLIDKFLKKLKLKKTNYGSHGVFFRRQNDIVLYKHFDFLGFITTLSHEYGHFIDDNYPDLGMLGAQIAYNGFNVYAEADKDHEQYRVNPTEASSFKIGEIVREHIEKVLTEEAIKKYDYLKTYLAALELKKDKALDKLITLRTNILKKRGLLNIVTILPTKMQQAVFRKLEKENPTLQNANKLRDETWHKYYWFKEFVSEINQTIQERAEKQKILSHSAR